MKLRELAEAFARLEAGSRRLDAVRIVAGLFEKVSGTELEAVAYLLQGQLRPVYEGVELGLGERLLHRAVARACDAGEAVVARRFKRLGDLGLVAEVLTPKARRPRLTVGDAYRDLLRIAAAGGSGSVERKTVLLAELLRRATPIEARYLVRIVQGRLRLGVGDATLLEAAAAGALGSRARKHLIEDAYNVRSDLGGVIRLAYARGARGLSRIGPKVGVPVRPELAQRLGSARAIIARLGTVQAEPK
ncbi:MAG TPA: hypothetical protein VF187_10730, partial [Gemmatimonadales bacterium]